MTSLKRAASIHRFTTGLIVTAAAAATVGVLTGQTATYTLYYPDGRRTLIVRTGASPETLALEQLTGAFGLSFNEDRLAGGLVITTRKDRIVAVPGQSFINISGRVVGLDGPIRRERNSWIAPLDFLSKALGPAIGEPVVIRRSSRLILIGNVRVPQISGRVERTSAGARVVLSIQPATPHRVTRDGNKLVIRFEAAALDATPVTGFIPEFASAARVEGSTLTIDLGPQAGTYRAEDDRAREGLTIELMPPAPVAPPPTLPPGRALPPPPPPPPPQIDLAPGLRTIVLDPGHGGEDTGVKGPGGTVEKDITLQIARRLRSSIESRIGVRVLLTRDADEVVPIDRRAAFANHNKADLLLSIHANGSVRPGARGLQVYSLDTSAYPPHESSADAKRRTVPVLGGGTRILDPMPWDLAQLPFAAQSAVFVSILIQQFTEKGVTLHARPAATAPMRVLAGANMPAVLIEFGFLSNAEDQKALTNAEGQAAVIEGILAAIADVRRGFPTPEGRRAP